MNWSRSRNISDLFTEFAEPLQPSLESVFGCNLSLSNWNGLIRPNSSRLDGSCIL